jgi:seryl-tRNA synthetase
VRLFLEIALCAWVLFLLERANRKLRKIMATQKEAAAQLEVVSAALVKIGGETQKLLTEVQALKDAAANASNVEPELQAAIDKVASQAQVVDDQVPDDVPVVPPTEG